MTSEVDVFAAMFTVIQDFVRDSFGYRPGRQLRQLSFGDLNGFIAPGNLTYLAVMYQGRMGPAVRRALVRIVRDLESNRKAFIEAWDGNRAQVAGLDAALGTLIRARAGILVGLFPPRLAVPRGAPESQSRP